MIAYIWIQIQIATAKRGTPCAKLFTLILWVLTIRSAWAIRIAEWPIVFPLSYGVSCFRTSPIYDDCSSFFASANQHDLFLIMDINAACFGVNFRQNNYDHKGIKYYLLSSGNTTINALRRLAVSISNLSRCLASNAPVSYIFITITYRSRASQRRERGSDKLKEFIASQNLVVKDSKRTT